MGNCKLKDERQLYNRLEILVKDNFGPTRIYVLRFVATFGDEGAEGMQLWSMALPNYS